LEVEDVTKKIQKVPTTTNFFPLQFLKNDKIFCYFKNGIIKSKKIIFATNGFLKSLGIKTNYNCPLTLTASMTRPLTHREFKFIREPKEWGVLPVRPMGATVRMTKDRRILIRNTAEVHSPFKMIESELKKRSIKQKLGINILPYDENPSLFLEFNPAQIEMGFKSS
jgi:hypothetical protein